MICLLNITKINHTLRIFVLVNKKLRLAICFSKNKSLNSSISVIIKIYVFQSLLFVINHYIMNNFWVNAPKY